MFRAVYHEILSYSFSAKTAIKATEAIQTYAHPNKQICPMMEHRCMKS